MTKPPGSAQPDQSPPAAYPTSEVLIAGAVGFPPTEGGYLRQLADNIKSFGIKVQLFPDELKDLEKVEFAICFAPPPGLLERCPNLHAVQNLGAGVPPSMLHKEVVPSHLPILRLLDRGGAANMANFVHWAVLNFQRKCDAYLEAQKRREWNRAIETYTSIQNHELVVGIMGLGHFGTAIADQLVAAGYHVSAWTRTPRKKEGVSCFSGREELQSFAAQADVVVCVVPLTPETRGLLNGEFFSWMKRGGLVINTARGANLVEEDLIAALESGQLGGAVLDVTHEEPLPPSSPLWSQPRCRIFPHISAIPDPRSVAEQMLENRQIVLEGQPLPPNVLLDRQRGY